MRLLLAPAIALGFCLVMAGEAVSQTSLDDPLDDRSAKRIERMEKVVRELRAIVFQGRETGQPVVIQPAETESQISALTEKITDLEQSLTRLNGQIETTNHTIEQARRDMAALRTENDALKAQVAAMDQKMAQMAAPPPQPAADTGPGPATAASIQDSEAAFGQAKRMLLDGDYASAEQAFGDFVAHFGNTPRGPEAHYYLAKTLIARSNWVEAATHDIAAIRGYPPTPWAAEAMLDLSRALVALRKPADACNTLDELSRRYPRASMDVKNRGAAVRTQAKCPA